MAEPRPDLARAAAVLGVAPGANPGAVLAAFTQRARETHPDLVGGDGEGFRELVAARDLLLRAAEAADAPRLAFVDGPRPHGPKLLAAWAVLLALAAVLGIVGADHSGAPVEGIVRWAVLLGAGLAFGATGRRLALVVAVLALLATLVVTLAATTWGALVALLVALPAIAGLASSGFARARRSEAGEPRDPGAARRAGSADY